MRMSQITYTTPQAVATRADNLKEFHFKLEGLVVANCIHYSKNVSDTIEYAKKLIQSYIKRSETNCELSANQRKNMGQAVHRDSGWSGIVWKAERNRWTVVVTTERYYIGTYTSLSGAIQAKRKANIRYNLPEFTGRK